MDSRKIIDDKLKFYEVGNKVRDLAEKLGNGIPTKKDIEWAKREIKKYEDVVNYYKNSGHC